MRPTGLTALVPAAFCVFVASSALAAPPNDTCAGALPLTLNIPQVGTLSGATNDYQLNVGSACYHGGDSSVSTAAGPEVVYSFTAPAAGSYSFRTQWLTPSGWDAVLWVAKVCPVTPPTPQTIADANCLDAANRQGYSSAYRTTEENACLPLNAGDTVYVFVDETSNILAGSFSILATACASEVEGNSFPSAANPFVCGIEGSIDLGDVDYFALGTPPAGSRVFAIVDALAGKTDNVDMRVTTPSSTLEFDDKDNDIPFGDNGPNIQGRQLTGEPTYIQVAIGSGSTPPSRPYRVYAAVQPPGAGYGGTSATAETEPNNTIATANVSGTMFFSGSLQLTSDKDVFRFCAKKGDLITVGLDVDPLRGNVGGDGELYLYDQAGTALWTIDDSNRTSSTASGIGNLFSTTPSSPGEALYYWARYSGVYYAAADVSVSHGQALFGDYLLSIAENCQTGSELQADLSVSKTVAPNPATPGANITYTVTVTNNGPAIALDPVMTDTLPANGSFVSITPASGWSCGAPGATISCTTPCLEPGVPQVFTIVVTTPACAQGAVSNGVSVTSKTNDSVTANNSASATTTLSCDDQNPCTDDACNPAGGCQHAPNTASCSDGNACTVGDVCGNESCQPGTATNCDDSNPCTTDSCNPATGACVNANNSAACDDGNPCTIGDTCSGGQCVSGPPGGTPTEAHNVSVAADKVTFSWSAVASATQYDVVRGSAGAFPVGPGGADEICFGSLAGPSLLDAATPGPGDGFWYLARGENACGNGTFGTQGLNGAPGAPRVTASCP